MNYILGYTFYVRLVEVSLGSFGACYNILYVIV